MFPTLAAATADKPCPFGTSYSYSDHLRVDRLNILIFGVLAVLSSMPYIKYKLPSISKHEDYVTGSGARYESIAYYV